MNHPMEVCRQAETKIRELQQTLLDPRVETLDLCRLELVRIAATLDSLTASSPSLWEPGLLTTLQQIRRDARELGRRIEYGASFCRGWIQLSFGTGYTQEGLPVFAAAEAMASFEA